MMKKIKKMLGKASEPQILMISDLLHGTSVGKMQSVGLMQVLPLCSELEDDRFVSPNQAEVSTQGYGKLVFENQSDQTLLVPCHTGYVVEQAAQDHAMAHTGLIAAKKKKSYDTAMCIQQSQGGYIQKGSHKMVILPHALREAALEKRDDTSFSKLWDDISHFNKRMGLQQVGNLVVFLKNFKQQLDHFVAEFECVPQQVGAIILIAGEVVGIERAPSHAYWTSIWEALIRECYGSKAIEAARLLDEDAPLPSSRIPLQTDGINSLDDLAKALEDVQAREEEAARATIRELLDEPFTCKTESSLKEFHVDTVKNDQLTGQIVRDGQRICYASLIVSKQWTHQREWQQAQAFTI